MLVESKSSMISARLTKRVRALGLNSLDEYLSLLTSEKSDTELINFLSALTTNVSHFFREEHHFNAFRDKVIPEIREKVTAGEKYRVWSAGCSTGQEIYSLLITLAENFREFEKYDIKFLATDIDPNVLDFAEKGKYSEAQTKGIAKDIRNEYFSIEPDGSIKISDKIKRRVLFRRLNLLSDWPMKSRFDVIFCRNVVIYFDEATQNKLWSKFQEKLNSGGWLFIGHSERIQDSGRFCLRPNGITTYRKLS